LRDGGRGWDGGTKRGARGEREGERARRREGERERVAKSKTLANDFVGRKDEAKPCLKVRVT